MRGRQKRGPGAVQTRDQNLPKYWAYFFRINYGIQGGDTENRTLTATNFEV